MRWPDRLYTMKGLHDDIIDKLSTKSMFPKTNTTKRSIFGDEKVAGDVKNKFVTVLTIFVTKLFCHQLYLFSD